MKTIIILGGSSSIGKSICNEFNTQDNQIISTYFSKKDLLNNPKNTESIYLDLNDNESIINFSQKLVSEKISVDILVSLAGILPGKDLLEYSFEEIDEVLSVNFKELVGFDKLYELASP